jgi:anti-sigma B factor antagonist
MSSLYIDVVSADEGPILLRVSGDLENRSCEVFRTGLERAFDHGRPVIVDLTGLDFLDSSGLGALLDARRRSKLIGVDLRVTGQRGAVARLLHRTGTLTMLTL